jgi:hypothetical protein
MTVVILDRFPGPLPPYAGWLGDSGADLVLFTARPADEVAAPDTTGYAEVRSLAGYATSAEAERAVLDLAEHTEISALVATAGADLVRAGALRNLLGLPGQGRDEAVLFTDPVAMRELLSRHEVPTVPCGPVQRVSDLYWYAHRWGYPIRVRRRRPPGWPTVAMLHDEAEVREFTTGGLSPKLVSVPSLLAEPWLAGDRRVLEPGDGELPALVAASLSALPAWSGYPYRVEVASTGNGELVDVVGCDVVEAFGHRDAVRAQAGLSFNGPEVARWAS